MQGTSTPPARRHSPKQQCSPVAYYMRLPSIFRHTRRHGWVVAWVFKTFCFYHSRWDIKSAKVCRNPCSIRDCRGWVPRLSRCLVETDPRFTSGSYRVGHITVQNTSNNGNLTKLSTAVNACTTAMCFRFKCICALGSVLAKPLFLCSDQSIQRVVLTTMCI